MVSTIHSIGLSGKYQDKNNSFKSSADMLLLAYVAPVGASIQRKTDKPSKEKPDRAALYKREMRVPDENNKTKILRR